MYPEARQDGLIVQTVGDETIVYDQMRDHAHRLNRTAALVWQSCDGRRTVADLSQALHAETGVPADEALVVLALDRLTKGHLLKEPYAAPGSSAITRRDVMRKLAVTGAMTLMIPVVQSMVAPTPAMAMSVKCGSHGQKPGLTGCCPGTRLVQRALRGPRLGQHRPVFRAGHFRAALDAKDDLPVLWRPAPLCPFSDTR